MPHKIYLLKIKGKAKIPDYIQVRDAEFTLKAYFRLDRPEKNFEKLGLGAIQENIMQLLAQVPFGKIIHITPSQFMLPTTPVLLDTINTILSEVVFNNNPVLPNKVWNTGVFDPAITPTITAAPIVEAYTMAANWERQLKDIYRVSESDYLYQGFVFQLDSSIQPFKKSFRNTFGIPASVSKFLHIYKKNKANSVFWNTQQAANAKNMYTNEEILKLENVHTAMKSSLTDVYKITFDDALPFAPEMIIGQYENGIYAGLITFRVNT